ncbi:PREDICTED: uncharacterized protein LOC105562179 [Vollenhovia emeryi]|uniref:uncharacterized protein LOC105562179 n=1 Tax=Vollenhovia emeryi TaxID=411798 RepID=UPI0005F4F77D|nr:PREDICTED: uncharacterized protein LOC105562179 [Vollenhovia emeryi]
MLAASICHDIQYTVLPSATMSSRVPRCLFGQPNPRDTIDMLQETLNEEQSKFARRWGVDPRSEDKENNYQRRNSERCERSPGKKRGNPYSRQTSMHDYWRARKACDVNKKPLATTMDASKQNVDSSKTTKTTATTTTTTTMITKTA